MALPATDNFNRANEVPIATNWSTAGNSNGMYLVSNQLHGPGTLEGCSYWDADAFGNDQYSSGTCITTSPWGGGPAVRISASVQSYYFFGIGNGYFRGCKYVAGVFSQIGSNYTSTPANGDVLKLSISGTTLTPTLNSVEQSTRTDSSLSAGSAGMAAYDLAAKWDNWEGGDVAAGGISISVSENLVF